MLDLILLEIPTQNKHFKLQQTHHPPLLKVQKVRQSTPRRVLAAPSGGPRCAGGGALAAEVDERGAIQGEETAWRVDIKN